jgi:hypothetical protein
MKPVFQTKFDWGQGNCAHACIASIFELPLEEVDATLKDSYAQTIIDWTKQHLPHLEFHNRDLAYNYQVTKNEKWTYDVPKEWNPPTDEYWMAAVESRGLKRPDDDPYYPLPALHAVVMHGRELVHDPNPKYQGLPLTPMVMQSWWTLK